MDGENNGKPYEQMGWFGGFYHPYFWFNTHIHPSTLQWGNVKSGGFEDRTNFLELVGAIWS